MSNAPFCNVKGVTPDPNQSAAVMQPIPVATDMNSALAAIRVLRNNFNVLNDQINRPPAPPDGASGFKTKNNQKSAWVENPKLRLKEKVRVENPDNPDQFVEVEQINGYSMTNQKTGEVFTWKR